MRWTARRARLLILPSAIAAMAIAGTGAAAAGPPDRQVGDFAVDVAVSSCGFPVHIVGSGEVIELGFGDRQISTFPGTEATLTNEESGKAIRAAIPGPELVTINDDGTVTVVGTGPWLFVGTHPVTHAPGIWLIRGRQVRTFLDRQLLSIEFHGSSDNLCDALR
jgi:hypothetical protein